MVNPVESSSVFLYLLLMLYVIAAGGYVFRFIKLSKDNVNPAKSVLVSAILLHITLIIYLFRKTGTFPLSTVFEGLFFCSLIFSSLYVVLEFMLKETCYGAFLLPINVIVISMAVFFINSGIPLPESLNSIYFILHAAFLFTAYACFLISCIISIMYLLQFHKIKKRQLGYLFKRLPALENMDVSIMRIDALGLALLFIGLVIGFMWLEYIQSSLYRMDIKIGFSLIVIGIYLIEHLLRVVNGWKGQRAAYVSIIGFVFVLITLIIGRHGY